MNVTRTFKPASIAARWNNARLPGFPGTSGVLIFGEVDW